MSDADSGDVFLRNRDALLDALLSDPAFGSAAEPDLVAAAPGPGAVSAPPAGAPDSLPPLPDFDPGPDTEFGGDGASLDTPERGMPSPDGPGDEFGSGPVDLPPRTRTGPSASERINALLSGQLPDPAVSRGYAAEFAERPARSTTATAEPPDPDNRTPEPVPGDRSTGRGDPAEMLRDIATQLRKPKVGFAVAAVVALLLVLLLVNSGDKPQTHDTGPIALTTPGPAPAATPTATGAPAAGGAGGTIEIQSATAKCPPGGTDAMDAFSGEPDKAWSCQRAYKVDGQVMRIDLGGTHKIDSIGIVPGWDHVAADGTDQWTKYRTVSRVSYTFDDPKKTTYTQQTLDQRSLVVTPIDPPLEASEIVLTVLKSSGATSATSVAISSIVITGE